MGKVTFWQRSGEEDGSKLLQAACIDTGLAYGFFDPCLRLRGQRRYCPTVFLVVEQVMRMCRTTAAGIIIGQLSEEEENMLVKFLKYEARREDIPVFSNVDFVHRTPMTVVPRGAMAEIDCSCVTFKIMESGVVE